MFFGFGWAVLGGFLLTATKNWVRVRGYSRLCADVPGGRMAVRAQGCGSRESGRHRCSGFQQPVLRSIVGHADVDADPHRSDDAYRDNYFFLLILPLFLLAKYLMLSGDFYLLGWSMAVGLFRMAFLVMLERTLVQFMKGVFQVVDPA